MADSNQSSPNKPRPIRLKYLDRVENLNQLEVATILKTIRFWVYDFYNQASGNTKVNGNFRVRGFALEEFDLSTSADITAGAPDKEGKVPDFNQEPYLFMCDLVHFVEQTYRPVPNQFGLTLEQINLLNRLPSLFSIFQVTPSGKDEIKVEDLKRMEDFDMRQHIIRRIDEVIKILKLEKDVDKVEVPETKTSFKSSGGGGSSFSLPFPPGSSRQGGDSSDNSPPQTQPDESRRRRPDDPSQPPPPPSSDQPFRLAELDPQAKLYLQSLSIITINQALSRYFNDDSLAQMGLAPGTRVTFDHLPLKVRQQLMDRAFSQVETLMLSGKFTLNDLINNSSARINFTNQSALNLLIDVHGLRLLNQAVSQLVKDKKDNQPAFEKELQKNERQQLKDKQLSERVKSEKNITDTKSAEAQRDKIANDQDLLQNLENQFNVTYNESQLDEALWTEIVNITGNRSATNKAIILDNVRSLIEVYIQQGLPPEYLISSPDKFDYSKFINLFGRELSPEQFKNHKVHLANLVTAYWKRKRAIWAREIRREFAQEKYTAEEAARLAKKGGQARANKQGELRTLNYLHGGRQVAQALADPTSEAAQNNPLLAEFLKQEQELIGKQIIAELAKRKPEEKQIVLKTYYEYYLPGVTTVEYNEIYFIENIVPQISAMDAYLISGNLAMQEMDGRAAFTRGNDGLIQQAFGQPADDQGGDNLVKNELTRKALEWGIRAAAGAATSGASEAFFKAMDADPTGISKAIKDKYLNQILDFLIKNWWIPLLLVLAAIAPLLAALAAVLGLGYMLAKAFGGASNIGPGIYRALGNEGASEGLGLSGREAFDQLAPARASTVVPTVHTIAPAQSLVKQLASPAMVVAGQAVVATAGASLFFMYMYQANLNSAFLVDFPFSETEIMGNIEKESKYAEIKKTAKITRGCLFTENSGTKCVDPNFPLSIEYTVTITPLEDFLIKITNISDEISFKQSEKGWEEVGQAPPIIPSKKDLDFEYFRNIIFSQDVGGASGPGTAPTPIVGEAIPSAIPSQSSAAPTPPSGEITIPAGSSLTFTYTLDDLNSDYNHTAIQNIIKVDFYYQNSFMSGMDQVVTAARTCLGNCSGDVGCWPMDGNLSQMPFDSSYSHAPNSKNSRWHDAYDLGSGLGDGVLYGNNVYVPYDGELCFQKCTNDDYGCYFILNFNDGANDQKLMFAHFQDPMSEISTDGACMQVQAGQLIGKSGDRGLSDGNHLHYAAAHGGIFSMLNYPGFSILTELVPEDDRGQHPPVKGNTVSTCYE